MELDLRLLHGTGLYLARRVLAVSPKSEICRSSVLMKTDPHTQSLVVGTGRARPAAITPGGKGLGLHWERYGRTCLVRGRPSLVLGSAIRSSDLRPSTCPGVERVHWKGL